MQLHDEGRPVIKQKTLIVQDVIIQLHDEVCPEIKRNTLIVQE